MNKVATRINTDFRNALLQAGLTEFAHNGYDGARLERIAAAAGCAKRMLYYYFGNKKDIYLAVLDYAYSGIRNAELRLDLDELCPREALHRLALESFTYHETHVDFTRLVLQENFCDGSMIVELPNAAFLREAALGPIERALERGKAAGMFNADVTADQVHFIISAISSFRVDHADTWKGLLKVDLLDADNREIHKRMLLQHIDAMVANHSPRLL